jgi:GT2 family glycosyltransferase
VTTAGEEVLLCQRARELGWRVVYEPRSVVEHELPETRTSWRWFVARAYAAGQEHAMWGPTPPLPARHFAAADHAFRAIVAAPFMLGRLRRRLFPAR